jgi:hypothetical protein
MSNKAIEEFLENRNPAEYGETIEEMMSSFVISDEFATAPKEERKKHVLCYRELKAFINRMIDINQKRELEQAE